MEIVAKIAATALVTTVMGVLIGKVGSDFESELTAGIGLLIMAVSIAALFLSGITLVWML